MGGDDAAGRPEYRALTRWGRAVFWPRGARWRGGIWLLAIFFAYLGVCLLYPYTESGGVALLWMPNAVLVTALLRFRPRDWPYVYAAGLLAEVVGDLTYNVAPHQALFFGFVNAIEATLFVLCAALIAGGLRSIGLLTVRGALAVVLASVIVPALTGALGAVGSVWTFDSDYFTGWRTWWFGDSLGLLVGVPIGLLLRDALRSVARRRSGRLAFGGGGAAALLLVASAFLAASGNAWGAQQTAVAAAVLLALTFGAVGASTAAVLTATVTLIGLSRDEGFASAAQEQALLFVVFAAVYVIAAATESTDQAMGQLLCARKDLEYTNRGLVALHAELEVVVSSAADGIFTIDAGGVIQSANQAATALFGYQHSELLGHNLRMLMGEPYRSEHDSYLARYAQTGEAHLIGHGRELEARHKDGTIFPIYLTVDEFRQDGRQYFVGNVHDRSERVRQMADLVRSNRDLEQFAAVASHDLQTPARSILSIVEILREDLPPELLTDETAEFMDHLQSSAMKMREQISGLLQISRLKQTRDRYAQVNLTAAVEAAMESLAGKMSDSDAHVEVGDLGHAWGDQVQLRLLFENLLSNAIKYRDFNRRPQINIFATDPGNANSAHIVFQDNGIGIDADQRERVFEIFQRLHTASETQYQGTGIGLALCRRIVDQHHGRIEVDGVPDGPGSIFHVWLPKSAKSLVMQPPGKGFP